MIRLALTAAICLFTIAGQTPIAARDAPHRPSNLSSHPPDFFRDLLGGRVLVYKHRNSPAAKYYGKDGTLIGCWLHWSHKRFVRSYSTATWKIGTPRRQSNIEERWTSDDTGEGYLRRVIIYTASTGRFHFEAVDRETQHWKVGRDGWVQNEWPQILLDRCPALELPHDLPINEYQGSIQFSNLKANAGPIRNHPGSHIRFPGATGLGASNGQPTMTLDQVETAFRQYNKRLSIAQNGGRLVFLAQSDHREIWRLDQAANVLDVGIMRLSQDGTMMNTQWEKSGRRSKFLVGYPMPSIPTDELHPVFAMMDELTASRRPVTLPSITTRPDRHVFAADGTVRTQHSTGKWRISGGAVHVDIDGAKRTYPWKDFAQRASWTN